MRHSNETKLFFTLLLLLALTAFCALCGCNNKDVPSSETDTDVSATVADTDPGAEKVSGTITETEPETEPETEVPVAKVVTFPEDFDLSGCISTTGVDASLQKDDSGSYLALKITKTRVRVTLDYAAYLASTGMRPADAAYLVFDIRVENGNEGMFHIDNVSDESGRKVKMDQSSWYDADASRWQPVAFNLSMAGFSGSPEKIVFDFHDMGEIGDVFSIRSITLCSDVNEMLTVSGHPEYALAGEQYDLSDPDPRRDKALTAPDEDASVLLWFDHITEKVMQTGFVPTERRGYTVFMGKNDAEALQVFISPESDRRVRVELDPLTGPDGHTLSAELMYEYYFNVNKVLTPDALPPLTGSVTVKGGQSQGFVVQVKTTPDTPAGDYSAVLHIFDDETGKEIKRAEIGAHVWDFALSDESPIRTAFGLYSNQLLNAWPNNVDKSHIYENAYNMLLDYRVNCLDLPVDPRSPDAEKYLADPRVNTFRSNYYDINHNLAAHPEWLKKCIFYIVDEPDSNEKISSLMQVAESIRAVYPEFRQVSPFYCNYELNADHTICTEGEPDCDQLCYMAHALQIWCCKLDAFTPRNMFYLNNVSYLESNAQEKRHGTFIDRMKEEVEGGDELWAYVCCTPIEPYANWQLTSDGIETILSFWQCKQYDVTGMLYWCVNFWNVDNVVHDSLKDPLTWPGVYWGDGMLVWGGHEFGLDTTIPSLRLINVRDGIDDYQMLCMLEDLLGEEKADEIISIVSSTVVTFSRDDERLRAARVLLGSLIEQATRDAK